MDEILRMYLNGKQLLSPIPWVSIALVGDIVKGI